MYPNEWTEAMFNRQRYPTTKFVEYQVDDFITEEAGIALQSHGVSSPRRYLVSSPGVKEARNLECGGYCLEAI